MRGIDCLYRQHLLLCCGKLGTATSPTDYVETQQAILGQTGQTPSYSKNTQAHAYFDA